MVEKDPNVIDMRHARKAARERSTLALKGRSGASGKSGGVAFRAKTPLQKVMLWVQLTSKAPPFYKKPNLPDSDL
jgi:hypothetical protein